MASMKDPVNVIERLIPVEPVFYSGAIAILTGCFFFCMPWRWFMDYHPVCRARMQCFPFMIWTEGEMKSGAVFGIR
jgi:hypothetical protein